MSQPLPPLNWLRAFEAAARHLSFTKAAVELNLTQAAISKQIKNLEEHLGERLFQRKPRSLVLTQIGAAYLPRVMDSFSRLADGTEEVFGRRGNEVLTVRISVGYAVGWLGSRLHTFFAAYPDTPLRIVSSVWTDAYDKERFDFEIRYGSGTWPGLEADRLTHEVLEPLCAPSLLQQDPPLRSVEDLSNHRLLHVMGYEEGWASWLRHAGAVGVNPGQGIQFDTSLLAFEVAATGGGIALGRRSMSAREIKSGRLVRPFDIAVPIDEAFYLVAARDGPRHPDADRFRNWLLNVAALDLSDIAGP